MVKVVIVMPTYNLEDYISEAIESVLRQDTNFEYKIFIADDCSEDNTLKIVNEYAVKWPGKIEIFTSDVNKGLLSNTNRVYDFLQCEYVVNLDGDDFWVSKDSLQKQVDYMDNHPECFLCAGNTQYMINGKLGNMLRSKRDLDKKYTFNDLLSGNMPFFHTSSIVLRNKIFINGIPRCFKEAVGTFEECALRGEDFRRLIHLEKGYLYAMDLVVSVYRIHERGLWQGTYDLRHKLESAISYNFQYKYFGNKHGNFFLKQFEKGYQSLIQQLILKDDILNGYRLNSKDNWLFISLLNDISGRLNNSSNNKNSAPMLWIKRILLKLIRSIM